MATAQLYSNMFVDGVHTMEIDLVQGGGDRLAVDFAGLIVPTPEPDSLMLLGTGLAGSAGAFLRKFRRA